MSNILTATVTIKGTRPLWWHHFGPDAIPTDKRQEKTGVAGNDPEEWRRSVTATKEGQLYIEGTYPFGCLKEGAKYTKKGKGSVQSALVATLQIVETVILIDRYLPSFPNGHDCNLTALEPPPINALDLPVYLDVRGVVNPSTKGRNVRYRIAVSPGWECTFSILWDKTVVSRGEMEAVIVDAGKLAGIGSGRKIGMGRFSLVNFSVNE